MLSLIMNDMLELSTVWGFSSVSLAGLPLSLAAACFILFTSNTSLGQRQKTMSKFEPMFGFNIN